MSANEKSHSYIHLAREELQQYTSGLLRENEALRAKVATLESDQRLLANLHQSAVTELDAIRGRFEEIARENERFAEQYHEIESHSSNLANLYVASYQLHASVERHEVLAAIQEIVINLIGSEEVAICEVQNPSGDLVVASSFGIDPVRLDRFKLGKGPIGRRLADGEIYVNASAAGGEDTLTACVPLKIGNTIIGAIMVFRLLEHKGSLQPVDHELFGLLAAHASTALYCASLHRRTVSR